MPDTPPLKPTFAAILPTSPAALLSAPRNWPLTWIVLVTGLLMTLAATLTLKSSLDRLAERDFVSHYGDIQDKITQRLDDHARLLQAGAGLFNASETVSREQWRLFSQAQNLAQELPGIQGIGFSLLIPWAELPRHLQGIRSEGFPDYSVKPEGDRELYSSIIYLEPFSGRNLRAFGYDMLTEPVRRAAMEQARDTNTVALSGKVVLVQETKSEVQAGTLMYLPIYRKGLAQGTVEQRRAAILGFVYSPYRMNDLLQGILGSRTLEQENHLHLQVFDGEQASSQSLLYACHSAEEEKLWPEPRFSRQLLVDFHGHAWTLRFSQTGGGLFTVEYLGVWLIMTCGMIITGLLFVLIKNLLTSRATIRRSAEALSESVAQLAREQQIILDTMPIGASFLKNRQVQVTNPAHDLIFGYEPGSIKGMDTAAFYADSESYQRLGQEAYAVLASGEIYTTEMVMKKKDGSHFFCSLIGQAVNPNKVEDGCIWMVQDISARKQAEARLRESEQQLAIAEEIGRTGSWAYNIATDEFWASTEARRIFAFPPGSARIPIEDVEGCIPERERVHQALVDLVNGVNEYTLEYSINPADGSAPKVISSIAKLERDALGKPLSVHGFIQDISERHQAVLALRQQEEFAHATIDGLSANICVIDAQGIIVTTNRAWDIFAAENCAREGTFGEGVCYLDVCQVPSATEQAGDNDLVAGIRAVLDGSLSEFVKEYPCHSPDVERWFSCRVNLFAVSGLKYAVISHENITERKLAEERLERSLKEKTVMLKEIHHRVKNNMQVVYSLLNLQARGITDPVTRAMFEESRNRVMSMAMIHENLYRADDLAFIDFNKYLRGLTAEIVETYQRPGVSIVVDQESLPLDINVGIPCGLIANELVSNSLKYAFPEGSKGEIRLGINKNSSGDNVLTVEDNGIGFPVALDFRKTASLGLELVNVLTDQIHGTIELQAEHGTKFSITFPDKPTKKSQFP